MPSRASNSLLMVDSRAGRDIEISLGDFVGAGEGLCRNLGRESQGGAGRLIQLRRHHPRKRMIQYAVARDDYFGLRGVLDAPPSRGMTAGGGGTGMPLARR